MNLEDVRYYIALTAEKRDLEASLRRIQDSLNQLEPTLAEAFAEDGVQHVNMDGYTIYLQQELWASPAEGNYDRLCDELVGNDLESMVQRRVNAMTLSAYVREVRRKGENLPEGLAATIKISEAYRVRVRKGDSTK